MSRTVLVPALAMLAACVSGDLERDEAPLFTTLDTLPSPAAPGSGEPNLVVGADGRVHLTWLEPAGDDSHALRFATFDGDAWSAPRTIQESREFFVNWADFPSLAVLPDGRLVAHWLQRSGEETYAYDVRIAQSADDGATWSDPVMPHRDGTQSEHGFVSLFPAGDSVRAVWLDGRNYKQPEGAPTNEMMLLSTTIAADGGLGAERRLDERICDCCQTAAALTSEGPVVVYRDRTNEEIRDISVVRLADGQWTAPRAVHDDNWRINACPVNGPAIAADGDRAAVAWFTAAGDTAKVNVAFSNDAGATFGAPLRVDAGEPSGRVDIALLRDGAALVTWIERVGESGAEVRTRRARSDGVLGGPVVVATSQAARASGFPHVARSGDDVYFAWTVPGEPAVVRVARARLAGQ